MTVAGGSRSGAGAAGLGTLLADRMERVPGLAPMVSFYRHIQFDLPRITTAVGSVLLIGVAAVRIYLLVAANTGWIAPGGSAPIRLPIYLQVYVALVAACALLACAAMAGRNRLLTRAGWALGSVVCAAAMAMYLTSRTAGLPGLGHAVGRWDVPLGTFAVALEGIFLLTHFAVLTGLTIAIPDRRRWRD